MCASLRARTSGRGRHRVHGWHHTARAPHRSRRALCGRVRGMFRLHVPPHTHRHTHTHTLSLSLPLSRSPWSIFTQVQSSSSLQHADTSSHVIARSLALSPPLPWPLSLSLSLAGSSHTPRGLGPARLGAAAAEDGVRDTAEDLGSQMSGNMMTELSGRQTMALQG